MTPYCKEPRSNYHPLRGWRLVTDERVLRLYKEVVEWAVQSQCLGSSANAPYLYTSNNIEKAIGAAHYQGFRDWSGKTVYDCAILLNLHALCAGDDNAVRNVLTHELAHCLTPGCNHDYRWEYVADILGMRWNLKATRYEYDKNILAAQKAYRNSKSPYNYELYCPNCGKVLRTYTKYCGAITNYINNHTYHVKCGREKGLLQVRKVDKPEQK